MHKKFTQRLAQYSDMGRAWFDHSAWVPCGLVCGPQPLSPQKQTTGKPYLWPAMARALRLTAVPINFRRHQQINLWQFTLLACARVRLRLSCAAWAVSYHHAGALHHHGFLLVSLGATIVSRGWFYTHVGLPHCTAIMQTCIFGSVAHQMPLYSYYYWCHSAKYPPSPQSGTPI